MHVNAFSIDVHNVTNGQFMEFVQAGGYRDRAVVEARRLGVDRVGRRRRIRPSGSVRATAGSGAGCSNACRCPETWPVYVTWAEANAFARWRGLRLPTEAEYHRAAFGTPDGRERSYPWGETHGHPVPGNFDFMRWDPEPVGAHPEGASAFGVHDLIGNGWEWTSTVFGPFDGFEPLPTYPEYSADFFDGDHFVMKGASPLTARTLVRRGFRNWFRPRYPYVYATFRCAGEA